MLARIVLLGSLSSAAVASSRAATDFSDISRLVSCHDKSKALLEKNTIIVSGKGYIDADFKSAISLLSRSDLIDCIQREYAMSLPEGTCPEFVLMPSGSNSWTYVNRHGQHSEVCEVARFFSENSELVSVFYACGERFFGKFESLTCINVRESKEGKIEYFVKVFAYPHQAVTRFIARNMGLIERFFRNKTKEIEQVSTLICWRLCRNEAG